MINLLPQSDKKEIHAARTNVLLMRYCIVSLACAALLFLAIIGVYYTLSKTKSTAQTEIDQSTQRTAQYHDVQKQVTEFTTNLATAKAILDGRIEYSDMAIKIAQALPSRIVLETFTLDTETFNKPMTLAAKGRSNNDAVRLKNALERSPYFDNVHLESVTTQTDTEDPYRTTISVNVTINGEAVRND